MWGGSCWGWSPRSPCFSAPAAARQGWRWRSVSYAHAVVARRRLLASASPASRLATPGQRRRPSILLWQQSLAISVDLLYLSTSLLWWQAVAAMRGVTSSPTLRHHARCTWRHSEGARNVYHTPPSAARSARCVHAGASLQRSTAAPEAWHRAGTLSRAGPTRWRTRGEKRPHRLTMPREAMPARLSSFRLLAMASPHWMPVESS
jgi:hypothetical protein